jgi:hypothetical protein
VIVHQSDIDRVTTFEAEDDAPVSPYRDRPKALQVSAEHVKPKPWQIQILGLSRTIQDSEDVFDFLKMLGMNLLPVALLEEPLQAAVPKASDHRIAV